MESNLKLRDYQLMAIEQTSKLLNQCYRPLIVAPTSSGKSVIQAGICSRAAARGHRILALCHTGEILDQNERQLKALDQKVKTALYCAGQGRKETDGQVFFASRDSLGQDPTVLGKFTLVIVDEAHLVSTKADTRYQKIFKAVEAKWIVGLTGTPWRLDNGQIWGKKGFFERISYNIPLDFLIGQGFIVPYTFPKIKSLVDTEGVKISRITGDYDEDELSKVSSTKEIVNASLDVWQREAKDRKCSIFFCCSIAHAQLVLECLSERIDEFQIAYIDGKTTDSDREMLFSAARAGRYRAIINVGVLTTGVDIKPIDCVVMLRATRSAALFVQCCGRGLRTHEGKKDLLILDLAGNFDRFGSLSAPLSEPGSWQSSEEKPLGPKEPMNLEETGKECPECSFRLHPAVKVCPYCQHIFISHGSTAFAGGMMPMRGAFDVDEYRWWYSNTKAGEKCVIVSWKVKGSKKDFREWLLYERQTPQGITAQSKLSLLLSKRITRVNIDRTNEKFPMIWYTSFSEESPVRAQPPMGFMYAR